MRTPIGFRASGTPAPLFVAVGDNFSTSPRNITTRDGAATEVHTDSDCGMRTVAFSPSLKLFVSGGPGISTSANGRTWSAQSSSFSSGASDACKSIAWSPDLAMFVAVGESNQIDTSTDGVTWTPRTSAFASGTINMVAWLDGPDIFIAANGSGLATSSNGTSWSLVSGEPSPTAWQGFAYSPSLALYVGVGYVFSSPFDLPYVVTTSDLSSWTERTSGFPVNDVNEGVHAVAWSPDLAQFVIVGADGYLARSSNGTSWTVEDSDTTSTTPLRSVAWSADLGLWVAVNEYVTVSSDGVTWNGTAQADRYWSVVAGTA